MCSYTDQDASERKRLEQAEEEAVETRQLNPLLKAELRLKILSTRHAQGKPEIEDLFQPAKSYDLTKEEIEKRDRRRYQNREAAKRCRQKRKRKQLEIDEEYDQEFRNKAAVEMEVRELKGKIRKMGDFLSKHLNSGSCQQQNLCGGPCPSESNLSPNQHLQEGVSTPDPGQHGVVSSPYSPPQGSVSPPDLSNCTLEEVHHPPDELSGVVVRQDSGSMDPSHYDSEDPTGYVDLDQVTICSSFFQDNFLTDLPVSDTTSGSARLPGMDSFINTQSNYISL